jgi:hypothetical protein
LQAVSHKTTNSELQSPAFTSANPDNQQQQQDQQHRQHLEHQLLSAQQELLTCRSQLSAANVACDLATMSSSQLSADAVTKIDAQSAIITRLELEIDRLKSKHAEAETSCQAATAALAAKDSEINQLRGMMAAAQASSVDNARDLNRLREENVSANSQLQQLAMQLAEQASKATRLQPASRVEEEADVGNSDSGSYKERYVEAINMNKTLSEAMLRLETAALEHSAKELQREQDNAGYQARNAELEKQLQESCATVAHLQSIAREEQTLIQSRQVEVSELQERLAQLLQENTMLKESLESMTEQHRAGVQNEEYLSRELKSVSEEVFLLKENSKQECEKHAKEVSDMVARCDALGVQVKALKSENELIVLNQKQHNHASEHQSSVDGKEFAAAKRQLENYALSESKLLLELNRRLSLAKRCLDLSQTGLAQLSQCSEIALTPTASVEEQPGAAVLPSAALSVLGKFLDILVLRMMDLKKISDSLSVAFPAIKSDSERLMSKIADLERMRAEWSEGQGDLAHTKAALAKQIKQQQSQHQADAAVLSILQSCGGVVQGEQLQQAAARVAEELKTARMTVSELARQVEVERSSSSSRNRVADSHGSELRAALVASEQRHGVELSAVKAQLRKSELQCQQAAHEMIALTKLNSELSEQVNVFESVLAEKDAEVAEVSKQLQLARALVTSLNEQSEVAVNLELVRRLFYLQAAFTTTDLCI